MKRSLLIGLVMALVAGLTTSCRTPLSGIRIESYPHNKLTINSKIVGGCLQVVECNATKRNELLQAQVTVENITQTNIPFQYRYRWLTKDGMQTGHPNPIYESIGIEAKGKAMLNAIAPNKEADDYILDVSFSQSSVSW